MIPSQALAVTAASIFTFVLVSHCSAPCDAFSTSSVPAVGFYPRRTAQILTPSPFQLSVSAATEEEADATVAPVVEFQLKKNKQGIWDLEGKDDHL
jgi:hypothetical protein